MGYSLGGGGGEHALYLPRKDWLHASERKEKGGLERREKGDEECQPVIAALWGGRRGFSCSVREGLAGSSCVGGKKGEGLQVSGRAGTRRALCTRKKEKVRSFKEKLLKKKKKEKGRSSSQKIEISARLFFEAT